MPDLAILVPVLNRPQNVKPLLESIKGATPDARVLFIADHADEVELAALEAEGAEFISPGGNYAAKIRAGVEATDEPYLFLGADDLRPRRGWFKIALASGAAVVGVNDLIRRSREHATHFLVTREYALRPTLDGEPGPLAQCYSHWFCDNELIATARHRDAYAYAHGAIVRHLHPMVNTAPDDATYERGRAKRWEDGRMFRRRSHLWT